MREAVGGHPTGAMEPITPVRNWVGLVMPMVSLAGMLVSAYLTWIHWSGSKALCAGVGDCEAVNTSSYAEVSGIPVALLGFGMYLVLLGLWLYGRHAAPGIASTMALAVFGISLAGVLYSAYLTYIELAVLHAICPWCVTSAALITVIFVLSLRDVMRLTGES